jgi:hypothetical protein
MLRLITNAHATKILGKYPRISTSSKDIKPVI